ncbi:RNA polymerase sigma factor [Tautonia rosea]|uniref:RNA polymerase sigma factor n=1 Tax=Tautonia rosea TaxID=2728037 RepID=UPI001474315B|nr:RNA polymerase sigma factor [Tautonia rosea]
MNETTFADLIARAKAGDEHALNTLLNEFEADVRLAVRRQLPRLLRAQFDSMDFVQLVWASVFAGDGVDPSRFENQQHLRAYLSGVAWNKVHEEYRRRTRTQKYDLRREEPLYVRRGNRDEPRDVPSADPTPSQNLQEQDCMDQLTAGRSGWETEALRLRREGLTFDEIALRVGVHERSVRRLIDDARQRMEQRRWR